MTHMEHAEILDVRPFADPDVIHVTPNNRVKPDTAVLAHDDITDDDCGRFNKTRLRDGRLDALKGANHAGTVGEVNGPPQGSATRV